MRIIFLMISAMLLSGCLESSTTTSEPVTVNEIDQPEINQPEINQPEINQPEINQPEINQPEIEQPEIEQPEVDSRQSAVSDMLINVVTADGDFLDYWDCSVVGDDDDVFLLGLVDDGTGIYQNSEGAAELTWREDVNGVVSFRLDDDIIEWRDFDFDSLFEFTADLYSDDEFVETDACVLRDAEEQPPVTDDSNFLITAQSGQDDDAFQFMWVCIVEDDIFFLSLFADDTGAGVFLDEDGELFSVFMSNWEFDGNTLETFSPDTRGSFLTLESIQTGNNPNSFTAADSIVGGTSFGAASCSKVDTTEDA